MRAHALFPLWFGAAALLSVALLATPALADYQKGLDAYDGGDYATALKEWKVTAEQGDARSQHGLGLLYDLGRGVPVDPAQAAKWYGLAAAQNLPDSESNLALLYAEGRGVPKDMSRADQLWLAAGKSGDVAAQFNLGLSYYRGEGVPKSFPDAAGWFRQAAEGGSVDGQYAIAEMYRLGRGVPKNLTEARRWFTKAAKAGNAAAADRLANLPPDPNAPGANPGGQAALGPVNPPPAQPPASNGESVNAAAPLSAVTKTPDVSAGSDTGTAGTGTSAGTSSTQLATVPGINAPIPATTDTTTLPATTVPDTTVATTASQQAATSMTAIAPAPSGSSNIVTFDSTGTAGSGSAPLTTSTDTGSTTVLTASGLPQVSGNPASGNTMVTTTAGGMSEGTVSSGSRNGQIPPANTANAPGMLVPTNSDVSPTTRVQIQTGATTVDQGPPVVPPAKTSGAINLGLPIGGSATAAAPATAPATTPVTSTDLTVASIPAGTDTAGAGDVYRVWIGTFKTENDALIYWGQELQRFPDLLKPLRLVVRQVDLGGSQGIWYRVLGGPFGTREAADNLCNGMKSRSPLDECRVVLN